MSDYIPTPKMGEILREEFMEPMNLSAYRLAQDATAGQESHNSISKSTMEPCKKVPESACHCVHRQFHFSEQRRG